MDPAGRIFEREGKIYRAINNDYEADFRYLFEVGAIQEMIESNLIPDTKISNLKVNGYNLLLEHKKIEPLVFSSEWSFEMLREAAVTVIKINKILFNYGFETKDAHFHNILFDKATPKFVDIGSFKKRKNKKYWECKDEFFRYYFFPLYIWSKGNSILARKSICDTAGFITAMEFFLYKNKFARMIPIKLITQSSYYLEVLRNLSKFDLDTVFIAKNPEIKRKLLKIIHRISQIGLLPRNSVNLERLERKIKKIKSPDRTTKWGMYHSGVDYHSLFSEGGRFNIVLKLLEKYNISDVHEIGGNQGILAAEIGKKIPRVICSDYDEVAVDFMFRKAKENSFNYTPLLLDVLHPIYQSFPNTTIFSPQQRFSAQAVIALALSHHLILGQKAPIELILKSLSSYSKEYLFIEFMPKGIDKSGVPDWYNLDWFRDHFKNFFELKEEIKTVKDGSRILLVGKKKKVSEN